MITIIAKNILKPGTAADFKRAAKPLVEASQKESGCISYDLYEDISEPNVLSFIECWKDDEALQKHNSSPHFTQIVPQLGAFRESSEIRLYRKVLPDG